MDNYNRSSAVSPETLLKPRKTKSGSPLHPRFRRSGNLLLGLSIGGRLTLGFLLAALIAAVVAGFIGVQRSQLLSQQSSFYQHLLKTNTDLTTGGYYLQSMNTKTDQLLETIVEPQPSQETLKLDKEAIQGLIERYDTLLNTYLSQDLLDRHPEQIALLTNTDHSSQVGKQRTLAGSALRTWKVYRVAQEQFLQDITNYNISEAQRLAKVQVEPTHADTLSALRSLIQFNQRLASTVEDATNVEEQKQLLVTIIASLFAFIGIILVGWFISGTLIKRLRLLREVTQAVEKGQIDTRVPVIGRDEIADVSVSVNAMLEAISNLLVETRQQRDALANAAEHLFSNMRVVSAGDLRVSAAVTDDPLGMLANAFNFTVGRFRRFVLRTQHMVEQLDVVSHREGERAEHFLFTLYQLGAIVPDPASSTVKKRGETQEPAQGQSPHLTKEQIADIQRLSQEFANEVSTANRQLAALVHEMRQIIVTFQLDTTEKGHMSYQQPTKLRYSDTIRPVSQPDPSQAPHVLSPVRKNPSRSLSMPT